MYERKEEMKKSKRIVAILLSLMLVAMLIPSTASASTKSVKSSYTVVQADNLIKALSVYAKDNFTIKYDGKKVIGCTYTQTKSDLKSDMFAKGGIKRVKKTSSKWTYQSVWSVNMKLMPKAMEKIAKKITPELKAIEKVGTIVKVTTTYEVNAKGTLKKTKTSFKWFTSLAKYKKFLDNLLKY